MWNIGDSALCVNNSLHDKEGFTPVPDSWQTQIGGIYTVLEVLPEDEGLNFCEDPDYMEDASFPMKDFRKIDKLTDEEKEEFLNDIKVPNLVSA